MQSDQPDLPKTDEVKVPSPLAAAKVLADTLNNGNSINHRDKILAAQGIINYWLAREIASLIDLLLQGPEGMEHDTDTEDAGTNPTGG